jgi:hypothetical protein
MRIEVQGRYTARALMDELLDAFPAWRGELAPPELELPPGARWKSKLQVQHRGDRVWLDVPDDADRVTIDAVLAAHNPDGETKGQRGARERREALDTINKAAKTDPTLAALLRVLHLGVLVLALLWPVAPAEAVHEAPPAAHHVCWDDSWVPGYYDVSLTPVAGGYTVTGVLVYSGYPSPISGHLWINPATGAGVGLLLLVYAGNAAHIIVNLYHHLQGGAMGWYGENVSGYWTFDATACP